jgi:hypothetical protein
MKLRIIFLAMDTLTLLSLPILYVYDKLRKLGRSNENERVAKPVAVRSNVWTRR